MKIVFEGCSKYFRSFKGKVDAIQDFSATIEDGEFFVLLGPSGCGKSTLLNLAAGLEQPTAGRILFGEKVVADAGRGIFVPPGARNVAMVFQSYALYPHMTVFDNVAFPLKVAGWKRKQIIEAVQRTVAIVGIEDLLDRKPSELSGGQRQRVAICRALVREPTVFLFDDPLSNLDAKLRVAMRAEISKLHHRLATTFIYVTHDQVEAMTMATRIAVIKDGILQQVDTPQTLYETPSNVFVAGFIGSPAMNFFKAKLDQSDGKLIVDTGEFQVEIPEEKKSTFGAHTGKDLIFGIRPEDVHDPNFAPPGIASSLVDCQVDVTELMGNEIFVHFMAGSQEFMGRVDPRAKMSIGDQVQIAFNMKNMHLFETEGGQVAIR